MARNTIHIVVTVRIRTGADRSISSHGDARILVRINGLAEMYRVFEFLPQDGFARISGHFQQKETRVTLG